MRAGSRGNPYEEVVTKRDLMSSGLTIGMNGAQRGMGEGSALLMKRPDGSYASMTIDEFAAQLFKSKLYKDLIKRLDDPSRFDDLPQEVRDALANSIAEEAAARGADIRSTETKLQSDIRSFAMKVDEVTAAIAQSTAGVRELTFANAEANRAQAGKVTQIEARLDDVGGVTIEESMTATADRVEGLAGEYMVKVQAGNKLAGFGLAASEDPAGNSESAFIVLADKFAIVTADDVISDPKNPSLNRVPFGVDSSGVYINGQVRINASGRTLTDISDQPGAPGDAVDIIFKRSAAQPETPPASVGAPHGWYSSVDAVPGGTDPVWSSVGVKASLQTEFIWQTPLKMEGLDGETIVELTIFQRASSAPATPTGGSYNFSTKILTPPTGWVTSVPTGTNPVYTSRATASTKGATGSVAPGTWTTPVISFKDGTGGQGISVTATSQIFSIDNSGTATPSSITLSVVRPTDINGTAVVGDFVWTLINGSCSQSLTTTNSSTGAFGSISLTELTSDSATFRCTYTVSTAGSDYFGMSYSDDITIVKVRQGVGVSTFLTNESHTVPASNAGVVSDWTGAGGTFKVYRGTTDVTTSCTFAINTNSSALTASIGAATGVYSVTGAGSWADTSSQATLTLRATYVHPVTGSATYDKVFTLTKSKVGAKGDTGTGGQGISVTATSQIFSIDNSGTATPSSITLSVVRPTDINGTAVVGDFVWTLINGSCSQSLTTTNSSTGAFGSISLTELTSDSATFRCTYTVSTAGSDYFGMSYSDDITIVKVRQGVGVSTFLTNESHTVPASNAGVVSDWTGAGGTFKVYRGTTDVTTSCTFAINTNSSALTASIGAATGVYSVTGAGSWADTSSQATLTLRATYVHPVTGSATYDKVFTLTKSRAGSTGGPGDPGDPGTRGSVTLYGYGTAWNNTTANNLITTTTGSSTRVIGDTVTLSDGSSFVATKYWGGASWVDPGVVIDGNLLVTGTVSADKISGNSLTAGTVSTQKVRISAAGSYYASGSANLAVTGGTASVTVSGTVGTPLYSWAASDIDGVAMSLVWVDNTASSVTFRLNAWVRATGLPWSGTLPVLRIWFY